MIDVSRMWEVRKTGVPILAEAVRSMKWGPDQDLNLFSGHPSVTELQKVTHMSTANFILTFSRLMTHIYVVPHR
jgi:hypothetical protein